MVKGSCRHKLCDEALAEIEKAKREGAKEIFAEIERVVNYALCVDITDWSSYTELKKKYTEGASE